MNNTNRTYTLLEVKDAILLDHTLLPRIVFGMISIILSLVLKFKCKTFDASGHFAKLYLICTFLSILLVLIQILTIFALLKLKTIRHFFFFTAIFSRQISLFLAPFVLGVVTSLSLLYSLALVFQRDETLKTVFQSKKGSLIIWIICLLYAFWCHPIHGYNRNILYFHVSNSLYPLVHINLIDFLFIFLTAICIITKLIRIRNQPKILSNFELASLIHISLTLLTTIMFFIFELLIISLSNSWKNYSFGSVKGYSDLKIWMLFSAFAPFLYPYSVAFSAVFSRVKKLENRRRTVTFNATRIRLG